MLKENNLLYGKTNSAVLKPAKRCTEIPVRGRCRIQSCGGKIIKRILNFFKNSNRIQWHLSLEFGFVSLAVNRLSYHSVLTPCFENPLFLSKILKKLTDFQNIFHHLTAQ